MNFKNILFRIALVSFVMIGTSLIVSLLFPDLFSFTRETKIKEILIIMIFSLSLILHSADRKGKS